MRKGFRKKTSIHSEESDQNERLLLAKTPIARRSSKTTFRKFAHGCNNWRAEQSRFQIRGEKVELHWYLLTTLMARAFIRLSH